MAIAVTGASGQVGTSVCRCLAEKQTEVLALNQGDDWAGTIAKCEAVIHLAGALLPKGRNSYDSANVQTTATVAAAARDSHVRRLVFLSYVGADAGSPNAYLRSKALAEAALVESRISTTVFRCLHIYGPPDSPGPTAGAFIGRGRKPVTVPGTGKQLIEPLYIGDVVAAVVRAVDKPDAPTGIFDLGGPDRMTMDDFVRTLSGPDVRIRHIPPRFARLLAHVSPALTPALMDLLLRDNITGVPPAEIGERFGFRPHRLADVWGGRS
jgi:nucleoside-diphosphate-sugar epimerase